MGRALRGGGLGARGWGLGSGHTGLKRLAAGHRRSPWVTAGIGGPAVRRLRGDGRYSFRGAYVRWAGQLAAMRAPRCVRVRHAGGRASQGVSGMWRRTQRVPRLGRYPHFLGSNGNSYFWGRCGACGGILGGVFGVSGFGRRRAGLAARAGGDGVARSLVLFQLAEAAVDGALDAAFVAGELDEGVGTLAIHVEGAGQEVALVGRRGRRRHRFAVLFGVPFLRSVLLLAEFFLCGDIVEAVAVDAGFEGEGAVQAPLVVCGAQDQFFFGGADGAEAIQVIVDEEEELLGVLVEQICLLARRPWRRRLRLDAALPSAVFGPVYFCAFRRLALIWASLGVRGSFVLFIFILAGACRPTSLSCYGERIGDSGGNFGKSLKTGGREFSWGCHRKPANLQKAGEGKRSYSFSDGSVTGPWHGEDGQSGKHSVSR